MKLLKPLLLPACPSLVLMLCLFSCSKTNESVNSLLYTRWAFTTSHGSITVNGNPLGVSESSNSNGDFTVSFQQDGKYNFSIPLLVNETDGFSLSDSTLLLNKDSSSFANFCAYPVISFISTPNPPAGLLQHVSPSLQIMHISRDSLLIKTEQIRPGVSAPDTVFTEYTGFRRK
jgi:hypothetical protein